MRTKFLALGCAAGVVGALFIVRAQADDRPALPDAVRAAIQRAYPQGTIGKTEREKLTITVYEVALTDGQGKLELLVAADGTIIEEERHVERAALPAPVAQAIERAASGAAVTEITRTELRARPALAPLAAPRMTFEAKWQKDGKRREAELNADGSPADDDDDGDGDEDDDGDDD